MSNIGALAIAGFGLLIGLAIWSVTVSKQAQTPQVFQAGGAALASIIGAAVQPVTGTTSNVFGSVGQSVGGVTT